MTRWGLPSTSAKELAITGMLFVASTIPQAIRWVKESLRPAALSSARREASVSTGSVRKLVAVGMERLSSMKRASVAAGPRIGLVPAPSGAGGAGAGGAGALAALGAAGVCPLLAASTSSLVIRPRGPVPVRAVRSTPSVWAIRAATGLAPVSPLPKEAEASVPARCSVASAAGATVEPLSAASPGSIRRSTAPTGTLWSASTRSSATVPATGEGTSASTLSVEISTSSSSTATVSPTLTRHSRTVPSATESPISGKVTSTSSAPGASPAPSGLES